MATQNERTDFYSVKYSSFDSDVARVVRREAFGEDIGQQGWRTETEQAQIIDLLGIDRSSLVLDICCGSGGPSLTLVQHTGCRLSGIDRESAGIAHARVQAAARGLSDQATFSLVDCAGPLPFENDNFDAVLCIDAVPHLPDRFGTLREWSRLLRKKGRLVFTDNAVVTGEVAKGELDLRTASGFFLFVPPGLNEEAVKAAGLSLLRCDDTTTAMAEIGARMCAARIRHAHELEREEGAEGFQRRQQLYAIATELAKGRRLSRFLYVAEKQ